MKVLVRNKLFAKHTQSGSSSGGTVTSVTGIGNIIVDNTDPDNPIISTTARDITVVTDYNALPDPTTVPDEFYWCSNPVTHTTFFITFTDYENGLYYSNGVSWEHLDTPIQASQVEVDAGTDTNTYVTPLTFTNASKWTTKQDTLVSGTNIKTVNGTTLLGSGNLAVGDALVANPLSQFAATTSAQLAGVISDETGSGLLVFATSPTLTTPVLGVASATSINKVAFTAPATSATLTLIDGTTITGPASTSTLLANNLGISGGTTYIGGTAATNVVIFQSTSGNQSVAAANLFSFKTGNNGANNLLNIGDHPSGGIGQTGMWIGNQSSAATAFLRLSTSSTYLNSNQDTRVQAGAVDYIVCASGTANVSVRKPLSMFTAMPINLAAGTTTVQPLLFQSGTNLTTGVAGSMEYNGTNLFFTRTGTTRENVLVGNDGAAAPATNTIGVIVDYYGSSATRVLTTPNSWASVVIAGTTYKIPLYT